MGVLGVLNLNFLVALHNSVVHAGAFELVIERCLQVSEFLFTLVDHTEDVFAVQDDFTGVPVLLQEPLSSHFGLPCLHLSRADIVHVGIDVCQLSSDLHDVGLVSVVTDILLDLDQHVASTLQHSVGSLSICLKRCQLLVHL